MLTRTQRILQLVKVPLHDNKQGNEKENPEHRHKEKIKILSDIVIKPGNLCQSSLTSTQYNSDQQQSISSFSPVSSDRSEYLPSPDYKHVVSSDLTDESDHIPINQFENDESSLSLNTLQSTAREVEEYKDEVKAKVNKCTRKKDFCFFCEEKVLNFARHIFRNHSLDTEIQKILALPKGSKQRRESISILRKRGNYIMNSSKIEKPMRSSPTAIESDYLPCVNCLGYYKRKQLWRHKRKCKGNKENNPKSLQSNAQTFTVRHLIEDVQLRDLIFPRMRADKVSLVAKKDHLICAFGSKYLKIHREKHFVNVVSRKMRELAKLLLELREKESKIKNLFDALRPEYYDLIVEATKKVSNFDEANQKYKSPSYAMNIATSLKYCANIAILYTTKKKQGYFTNTLANIEADLRMFISLLNDNWRFDVSSQAADDLNMNKWNKLTLVPLASDLKLLRDYLIKKAKESANAINNNSVTKEHYINMIESIYCRVILLNRRRPGELQRLLLDTFLKCNTAKYNYEEFEKTLSPSELILIRKFKRIVIQGKRNRGVPVLFSDDIQDDIKLLLSVRNNFIDEENPYLFARPGGTNSICGYKILTKNAKECGAKYPEAISATRLRKHLATLTQIFHMTENDIEQLASFMGHTTGIHKKSYRLPDDIYQTAKLSKLLLLMEGGDADKYKGKSLDEIDLKLDDELIGEENEDIEEIEQDNRLTEIQEMINERQYRSEVRTEQESQEMRPLDTIRHTQRKKRELVPWTNTQKVKAKEYFKNHIINKIPPKRSECEKLIAQFPDLYNNKNWLKIKVYIQNVYTKKTT